MKRLAILVVLVGSLAPSLSRAVPITINFSGTGSELNWGAIEGSYTFDSEAVDLLPDDPLRGKYESQGDGFGAKVSLFNTNLQEEFSFDTDFVRISIDADWLACGFVCPGETYLVTFGYNTGPIFVNMIFGKESFGECFDNDHLPLFPPTECFGARNYDSMLAIIGGDIPYGQTYSFDIELSAVPEPGTLGLLCIGILAMGLAPSRKMVNSR